MGEPDLQEASPMAATIPTIRRWTLLACALLLVSGALAACGGSDSSDDSSTAASGGAGTTAQSDAAAGGTTALDISATESGGLGFSRRALTARAGTVTITLANGSADRFPHAIAIEGNGVDRDGEVVQPGGTSTVTARLKPGTYTFYCPVGNHEAEGMKGTLTVQ
jgi:plastocyanin